MVLREHCRTLDLNLLILGNTKLETREGDTNGTLMIWHTKRVERARSGGFGQTITFIYGYTGATEERHQFRIKRSAARHNPLGTSSEYLTQRSIDHRIKRHTASLGQSAGLALRTDFLHVILSCHNRRSESHSLGTMSGLLRSRVVYLLEYTRNNDHNGRFGDLQIGDQRLDTLRDVNMQLAGHADVVDGACEGVCLRKEQQHVLLLLVQQLRHVYRKIQRGGAVMLMSHFHALRCGGGTGSVYDGA